MYKCVHNVYACVVCECMYVCECMCICEWMCVCECMYGFIHMHVCETIMENFIVKIKHKKVKWIKMFDIKKLFSNQKF